VSRFDRGVTRADASPSRVWRRVAPWVVGWVFFDRLLGVFALPSMSDVPPAVSAVVIGGPGVVWAMAGRWAGGLSDRVGQARTALVSLIAAATLAAAAALAPSPVAFAVLRTASASAQVAVLAAVSSALATGGTALGRTVGTSFMTTRFASGAAVAAWTWRLAFVVDALFVVLLASVVLPLREPPRKPVTRVTTESHLSRGGLLGGMVAVPALCVTMTFAGLATVPSGPLSSSVVQVAFGLVASVATLAAGLLSDRYTAWRVSLAGLVLGVAGASALAAGGPVLLGVVLLAATSGTVPLGLIVLPLSDAPPSRYGVATALPRTMAELLGGGLATVGFVGIGHVSGTDVALAALAGFVAVVLVLAIAVRRVWDVQPRHRPINTQEAW
jgi:hypothetical protein